jgi:hypothetical protein
MPRDGTATSGPERLQSPRTVGKPDGIRKRSLKTEEIEAVGVFYELVNNEVVVNMRGLCVFKDIAYG